MPILTTRNVFYPYRVIGTLEVYMMLLVFWVFLIITALYWGKKIKKKKQVYIHHHLLSKTQKQIAKSFTILLHLACCFKLTWNEFALSLHSTPEPCQPVYKGQVPNGALARVCIKTQKHKLQKNIWKLYFSIFPLFILISTARHTNTPFSKTTISTWVWLGLQKADLPLPKLLNVCFISVALDMLSPGAGHNVKVDFLHSFSNSHLTYCKDHTLCTGLLQ